MFYFNEIRKFFLIKFMDWKVMDVKGGKGKNLKRGRIFFFWLDNRFLIYIFLDVELIKLS